ncbi:mandelate racemase/muconate lactonizing enzyme family protein [Sphingobacterium chuzhouense]|uniref:Mandelate racemase/muconate lactonizing enzyme family protein n=1 Tax=Sphingobacterium chuzhouense TaxID=1742264 RepID=A0ABR7XNZ3_9SPHI|nr:mandelate racemase/muconate lactonizing enzyme family protein [Sphingobacterium chuzhouense]MBD1420896.1 mandelate racemase/muconate lactonizing enzyme family protein [Sphingobacterium chuzhouense]
MKITNVEAFILESPYENTAPEGSEEARGVKHCLLLKVSTDEGIIGWSDIETSSHVGVAAVNAPAEPFFEGLRTIVLDEDPFDVERLWDKIYRHSIYYGRRGVAMQLLSGFDIACHDIIGKAIGKPIYKILGGARRNRVRAYASTLFRPTPEAIRDACAFYLERGFTAIKFGWGVFGQDPKLDIKLVEAAREAVGPDIDLMVDPGWMVDRSAHDAIALCRALEPYNIYWLEDFMHPENYEGYGKTKAAGVKTRLAAGEQEATGWGFRQLIQQGGIDVVQPDITRCGGFTQMRKIMWEAEYAGVDVCPHAWLTDLNTAAALHVNAVLPRSLFLEYNVSDNPMLREVIGNPVQLEGDGYITVPDGPGLGIEVNEDAVRKFCVNL